LIDSFAIGKNENRMRDLEIQGLRIAYELKGQGPPLVLLHGALSDSRIWRWNSNVLSGNFTVLAWDAPGCGRSDDPPESFRLPDYADVLAELIQSLNLQNPHILGLSFGGGLALELYRQYPEIPKSLILVSAYAGWAGSLSPVEVETRLNNGLRQLKMAPEEVVDSWIPTLFSESVPSDFVGKVKAIMRDFHPEGMRTMLHSFAEADLREVLPKIKIPTLLLYGEDDIRSPLEVAEKLHSNIKTSKLVVIPGTGHVVNIETPAAFNTIVKRFINSMENLPL
jgi:pimeloyl-ACP methyl ester carboxylesterase